MLVWRLLVCWFDFENVQNLYQAVARLKALGMLLWFRDCSTSVLCGLIWKLLTYWLDSKTVKTYFLWRLVWKLLACWFDSDCWKPILCGSSFESSWLADFIPIQDIITTFSLLFFFTLTWHLYLFNENKTYSINDINSVFYNQFFEILILADVFILLLSFQYTEKYSQLIRNTGFIISTILIRLSFSATGLTNVLLIISSVLFGLIILKIYESYQKL